MGLDAYIQVEKTKVVTEDLWYGRKENAIHGWMQEHSGIDAEDFNCKKMVLTTELLKAFKEDLKAGKVTSTSGSFFGGEQEAEEIMLAAKALIKAAQDAIKAGDKPYYYSRW